MKAARLEWYVGCAIEAVQRLDGGTSTDPEGDSQLNLDADFVKVGESVGTPLGGPLSVPFTVEYSNFDRTERWASSHILTYTPLPPEITIFLSEEADARISAPLVPSASSARV